jgi:hypothetical protein
MSEVSQTTEPAFGSQSRNAAVAPKGAHRADPALRVQVFAGDGDCPRGAVRGRTKPQNTEDTEDTEDTEETLATRHRDERNGPVRATSGWKSSLLQCPRHRRTSDK